VRLDLVGDSINGARVSPNTNTRHKFHPAFSPNLYRTKDSVSPPIGPDSGPYIPYHYSELESAYWTWFWKTKPKPPLTLQREQLQVANALLRSQDEKARPRSLDILRNRAREIGVPGEALADDALFWAINTPANDDQLKVANAWKVAYLQRLRREKVDEPYIKAYLAVWKLAEAEAFGDALHK
jgi:hypothetical protein